MHNPAEAGSHVPLGLVVEKLPLFALAAASSIVTYLVQQRGGAVSGLDAVPFGLRAGNAIVSYVAYLASAAWPAGLTIIYGLPDSIPGWQVAGALLLLGGISTLVVRSARRRPYLPVGWFWYLGTLVPVIGLVPVGVQARADRYTYVPLIGVFIMIAWGVPELVARSRIGRRTLAATAVAVVLACAAAASAQVASWKDDVALWTRATMLTLHVDEYAAHLSLGRTLTNQERFPEAVAHFSEAVRLQPRSAEAHLDLGVALSRQGKASEAIRSFGEAVRLEPGYEQAHFNLGAALAGAGRYDEAIREFTEALRINPANPAAQKALEGLTRRF